LVLLTERRQQAVIPLGGSACRRRPAPLRDVGVRLANLAPVDGTLFGPQRAELWKTDDWAGPPGRRRYGAHPTTNLRAAIPVLPHDRRW
jgi:hypothetical protein